MVNLNRTKSFLFDLKCTKIAGGWGSAPDPAGGAYSAPPDPLAVRREWEGDGDGWRRDEDGRGRGEEGKGGRGGDFAILPQTSTSWLRNCRNLPLIDYASVYAIQ